ALVPERVGDRRPQPAGTGGHAARSEAALDPLDQAGGGGGRRLVAGQDGVAHAGTAANGTTRLARVSMAWTAGRSWRSSSGASAWASAAWTAAPPAAGRSQTTSR